MYGWHDNRSADTGIQVSNENIRKYGSLNQTVLPDP
jgi:hypothetical protein